VCSFRGGSLTDSDLWRLLASVLSWKERLLFVVDLPAPYLDEKLSDWRGLRANMMLRRRSELPMIHDPDDGRFEYASTEEQFSWKTLTDDRENTRALLRTQE
jgi:hypothetical protein